MFHNVGFDCRIEPLVAWTLDHQSHIETLDNLAEEIVGLAETLRVVASVDEELATIGVGTTIRHRDGTSNILTLDRLVAELITGATRAITLWIATLDDV